MTMSASPLRAASRWLDASRSTSSTRTATPASCAWIACATRDNSTFVPVRHSRTSIPPEYPASARRARAATAVHRGEDLRHVHGMVDRPPYAGVAQRAAPVVQCHVHHAQRRLLDQLAGPLRAPARRLPERNFDHAQP